MTRSDDREYVRISGLTDLLRTHGSLPVGLQQANRADVFVRQLVESMRRVRYLSLVSSRPAGALYTDPTNAAFDPLRALVHHRNLGHIDEAGWMAFLHVHFGKSRKWGWEYPRRVYGALDAGPRWTWARLTQDVGGFRAWLAQSEADLQAGPGGFGNHRKYESLSATSGNGTGAAVATYAAWIMSYGSHDALIAATIDASHGDPGEGFEWLVRETTKNVASFGRTASFDYGNLLSWTELAPISAGRCHIAGSTGPRRGAEILFGSNFTANMYERLLAELCGSLVVPFDVMEDAICNWQKSPERFIPFRG